MAILFNIGALVAAFGTLSTARVGILSWNFTKRLDRKRERRERRRRARAEVRQRAQEVLDVVVAIHTEVLSGTAVGGEQLTLSHARRAVGAASQRADDAVIEAVHRDIAMLPQEVAHSVAQYHRLARQTLEMLRHLRNPAFLGSSSWERTRFRRTFLQVVTLQKAWGKLTIADLEKYAADGNVDMVRSRRRADALLSQARRKLVAVIAHLDRAGRPLRRKPLAQKVNRKSA